MSRSRATRRIILAGLSACMFLLRPRGLTPTGSNGAYRRRDYLRGAVVSCGVGLVFASVLWLLSQGTGCNGSLFLAAGFACGIGILAGVGAALIFFACALLGSKKPPQFADSTVPKVPDSGPGSIDSVR